MEERKREREKNDREGEREKKDMEGERKHKKRHTKITLKIFNLVYGKAIFYRFFSYVKKQNRTYIKRKKNTFYLLKSPESTLQRPMK